MNNIKYTRLPKNLFLGGLLTLLFAFTISCGKPAKDFTSYESASKYIRATYSAEVMKPDSSSIYKVEYYSNSPEKWILVFFNSNKSKGYIYKGFSKSMWEDWKNASSKGRWYHSHLKGNRTHFFYPEK